MAVYRIDELTGDRIDLPARRAGHNYKLDPVGDERELSTDEEAEFLQREVDHQTRISQPPPFTEEERVDAIEARLQFLYDNLPGIPPGAPPRPPGRP